MSAEQKREAVLIVSVGCDRETAARYVGCRLEQLNEELANDGSFAAELRHAEAGSELTHMRNIQQAARDERHWRASVWWLERRLPERYARREAGSVTRRDLLRFLGSVASGVAAAVRNEEDRQRVLDSLGELAEALNDPLHLETTSSMSEVEDDDRTEATCPTT
ncbi:hypothetical protein [Botrimarina colliarenosi]|nr:hypothetical protein [Botrimarina colliarenosi]